VRILEKVGMRGSKIRNLFFDPLTLALSLGERGLNVFLRKSWVELIQLIPGASVPKDRLISERFSG
jgi:hypothetical protein